MQLELSEEDKENIDHVVEHLIDCVATFKGGTVTADDFNMFLGILDYGKYILSGVMYSNDIPFMMEDDDDE